MKCEQCDEKMKTKLSSAAAAFKLHPICTKCRKYNIHKFVNGESVEKIPHIGSSLSVYLMENEDEV